MKYLLLLLVVVGCAQKDPVAYLPLNQDISRACLTQCQGKMVDAFIIVDNKLKCTCKDALKEKK